MMRHCLQHADELQAEGTLLGFQQLEPASTAKAVRRREGKVAVVDGPFAETKEAFAGYYLYYPSRRQPTPAFTLLVEALRYRRR